MKWNKEKVINEIIKRNKKGKPLNYQAVVNELSKLEADRGIRILTDGGRAILKEGGVK
jgi:hypothetical protein